jgi:hypothetical protein
MPSLQDIHIATLLTNISVALMNKNFIGELVAPPLPVDKVIDKYAVYDNGTFLSSGKPSELKLTPGTTAKQLQYSVTNRAYIAETYAGRILVTNQVERNEDAIFNAQRDASIAAMNKMSISNEYNVASLVGNTANYNTNNQLLLTADAAIGTSWASTASANSLPFNQLQTAGTKVRKSIMRTPNTVFLTLAMAQTLTQHPTYKDWVKYTTADAVRLAGLPPNIIGLDVVVGEQQSITGDIEDNTPYTRTDVWADNNGYNMAIVYYRDSSVGPYNTSSFRTFDAPDPSTGVRGLSTRTYPDLSVRGTWVEVAYTRDYQNLIQDTNGKGIGAYIISDPSTLYA